MVKGQYLAVEEVMIIGLGLVLATALITLFDSYRSSLFTSDFDASAKVVEDRVINELIDLSELKDSTYAEVELDLRDEISNSEYQIEVNDSHVALYTGSETSSKLHKINDIDNIQGVADSGEISLVKNNSLIRVRS